MPTYIRTQLDNVIAVRSVVTLFRTDLRDRKVSGESHDFPEIFYVEQGQSEVFINDVSITLNAGSLIIYGPNTFHGKEQAYIPGGIVNIVSFETDSPAMEHLYNRPIKLNSRQRERFETIIARGQSLFKKVNNGTSVYGMSLVQGADPRDVQLLKILLESFLLDVSLGTDKKNVDESSSRQELIYEQQMEHLTSYLLDNLDKNLTLKEMRTALWISESSLRRLVQRSKGCGPIAYYQELRIREAKHLIQNTSMSMTEIAQKLGFVSLHYFSRLFRDKTGSSPTDYAKAVRNKSNK